MLKHGDILSTIFLNDLPSLLADTNYESNEKPKLEDTSKRSLIFADDLVIFVTFTKRNT